MGAFAMGFFKCWLWIFVVGCSASSTRDRTENLNEVKHLIGEPDFRGVILKWEFDGDGIPAGAQSRSQSFLIHYCELQAWGPHRCRTTVVDENNEAENQVLGQLRTVVRKRGKRGRSYSTKINGLRMATTYSFEVRPMNSYREKKSNDGDSESTKSIIVPTKGFSARATQCLPHASEVEVSTGPYFGGRIAVEAADGERCALSGDSTSSRDTYTLRIDHEECGSEVNDTTVATFVIVQENLPILTHSTRRFLVLCSYKPETLTVRAGINLPTSGSSPNVRYYRPHTSGSVEPYENADDSMNEINSPRLAAQRADENSQSLTQKIMTIILIVAGVAGMATIVWKLVPGSKIDLDSVSISSFGSMGTRNSIRNIDNQSDTGSIYSISLSECGHCGDSSRNADQADNTSEA